MVLTSEPVTLGELPTALGYTYPKSPQKTKSRPAETAVVEETRETITRPKDVGGRPSKFKTEMEERIYQLAILGASEKVMAVALDITVETLRDWTKTREKFSLAYRSGKALAAGRVASSILDCATGYWGPDDKWYPPSLSHQRWFMSVKAAKEWPLLDERTGAINVNVGTQPMAINARDPVEASRQYLEIMRGGPLPSRTIEHEPEE
jgi:hypothetical protein